MRGPRVVRQAVGAAGATALVLLAGCSPVAERGDAVDEAAATSTPPLVLPTDPAPTTEDPMATTARPAPHPVDPADHLTDEVLLERTTWVLDQLDPDTVGPLPDEVEELFSEGFLDQVPPLQLVMVFPQLRAGGPYTVTEAARLEAMGAGRTATLALHADEQPLIMTITLDEDDRISGLLFVPDTSGEPPQIDSWADLDEALTELGGTSQVVVAEVRDGVCTPVHTTAGLEPGGDPAPTGSVFKLMVLAGLVDAVEAGEIAWDDELTITEDVKSLPSGVLQDRETGSTVTVREAADLMISSSDNTATDLLIEAVGQPRLRRAMETAGVDAVRVAPVTTTKQLFILGWGVEQEVRDRWARASVPEVRAAQLADLPTDLSLVDVASVTTPVWQDGVDWSLTGGEVCGIHARLQQLATTEAGEPVREILSANPGGTVAEGVTYQGFKGGSAPGVLALSYYVETQPADGDSDSPDGSDAPDGHVLVVQTRSEEAIDQLRAVTIVDAGLQHLVGSGG